MNVSVSLVYDIHLENLVLAIRQVEPISWAVRVGYRYVPIAIGVYADACRYIKIAIHGHTKWEAKNKAFCQVSLAKNL